MDGTPVRINMPQGRMQRFFYRRDRGFHFINWLVVVDVYVFFRFGQSGYMGHLTDSTVFDYSNFPAIANGTYIMADLGFSAMPGILIPLRRGQGVTEEMRREINR